MLPKEAEAPHVSSCWAFCELHSGHFACKPEECNTIGNHFYIHFRGTANTGIILITLKAVCQTANLGQLLLQRGWLRVDLTCTQIRIWDYCLILHLFIISCNFTPCSLLRKSSCHDIEHAGCHCAIPLIWSLPQDQGYAVCLFIYLFSRL